MGQIIKSVCVCRSLCVCVCVWVSVCPCVITFTVAYLCRFSPNLTQRCKPPKVRMSSLGVNIAHPFSYFTPRNRHFWPRGSENPCTYKRCNICLKYSRIAKILTSYRKSGSANTMVTSDFWQEVEIRPFCACAMKNMQFVPYLWPNRQNSCLWWEIGVGEHDCDVRFLTGSRNKTVSRMRNGKYAIWPLVMAERENCCTVEPWTGEFGYGADTMFHKTYF